MNAPPIVSPEDQSVTFVELFFDLVFVFSVTQVTGLLHDHLDRLTIASAALVFWLVWWAWTQFTWALNAANTDHSRVRLVTLLATAVAFFLAAGIPDAFEGGALWFAIPYVAVRLIGLLLYTWVAAADRAQHAAVRTFALLSLAGLAAVMAGAVTGGAAQYGFWTLAIVLDIVAAAISGQLEGWNLHPGHFVERHGLIVIIALGESLIVAAAGLTGAPRSPALVGAAVMAVAVSCALWWSYFPYAKPALERAMANREGAARSCLARDIYSLAHFPMLCGIVAFAVAVEAAVAHPGQPLPISVRSALAAGVVLFLCGTAIAIWRATGRLLLARMVSAIVTAAVVTVADAAPYVSLGIVFVTVAGLLGFEHRSISQSLGRAAEIS